MKAYHINIVGLSNKIHHFDFEVGNELFSQYDTDLLSEGAFMVNVTLTKHETFMEAGFTIKGSARLLCDRSLESFEYPVQLKKLVIFKFGDEDKEVTDEISIINHETVNLDLGQYIYEFISLSIPMKKLHPKFQNEEDDTAEGKLIYSSGEDNDKTEEESIDPRWEQLKKLK